MSEPNNDSPESRDDMLWSNHKTQCVGPTGAPGASGGHRHGSIANRKVQAGANGAVRRGK